MEVVLVPGLWLTASSWDPVLPALREAGHTPVSLTFPGVGGTAAETADITMDDWVAAVAAVSTTPIFRVPCPSTRGSG